MLTPIIRTTSQIADEQDDPDITIELSGDTFNSETDAEDEDNWDFDYGDTNLNIDTIYYIDDETVNIAFSGLTEPGTLTIKALADALSGDEDSNELSITVE